MDSKNIDDATEFIKLVREKDKSIIKILQEKYSIDLVPIKIKFAEKLPLVINKNINCCQNEALMQTELGKFLLFVRKIL